MIERTVGVVAVLGLIVAASAGRADTVTDALVQDLQNPSTKTRIKALRQLGDAARADAAAPMAALLLDGQRQRAVRGDHGAAEAVHRARRPDAAASGAWDRSRRRTRRRRSRRSRSRPDRWRRFQPRVPAEVVTNLSSVMRQDDSAPHPARRRLCARRPRGAIDGAARRRGCRTRSPTTPSSRFRTRTRGRGRWLRESPGGSSRRRQARPRRRPIGDALVAAMNDPDPLVRRWAIDSLGWLRYDRAVQALTDHSSYYGRDEEGVAALHALARIANPASAPVLRALLANSYVPFRVIAIEGLGRIGDKSVLPQIAESQIVGARGQRHAGRSLRPLSCSTSPTSLRSPTRWRQPDTGLQARVYLAEIALTRPAAIHPLLKTPNPSTRMMAVQVLGASRQPAEIAILQPLLQDPVPDVVIGDLGSHPPAAGWSRRRDASDRAVGCRATSTRGRRSTSPRDLIGKVLVHHTPAGPSGRRDRRSRGLYRRRRPGLSRRARPHDVATSRSTAPPASPTST